VMSHSAFEYWWTSLFSRDAPFITDCEKTRGAKKRAADKIVSLIECMIIVY
jgi:hypothetical protein